MKITDFNEGELFRRPHWAEDYYITLGKEEGYIDEIVYMHEDESGNFNPLLTKEDIQADDWDFYR